VVSISALHRRLSPVFQISVLPRAADMKCSGSRMSGSAATDTDSVSSLTWRSRSASAFMIGAAKGRWLCRATLLAFRAKNQNVPLFCSGSRHILRHKVEILARAAALVPALGRLEKALEA
jgi:hypothetical protein